MWGRVGTGMCCCLLSFADRGEKLLSCREHLKKHWNFCQATLTGSLMEKDEQLFSPALKWALFKTLVCQVEDKPRANRGLEDSLRILLVDYALHPSKSYAYSKLLINRCCI